MGSPILPFRAPSLLRHFSLLCIAIVIVVAGWQQDALAAASAESDYRKALQLARSGQHEQALSILGTLTDTHPEEPRYRHDLVTVLGWAGRDSDALAAGADLDPARTPAYVLNALGKSARNVQDFEQAQRWYRAALARDAGDRDARMGLAMALAENGETAEARDVADKLAATEPKDLAALSVLGYVQQEQGRYVEALATWERILAIDPANAEASHGRIVAAWRLGAPHLAADLAAATPGVIDDDERALIERDRQAMEIQWNRAPEPPEDIAALEARIAAGEEVSARELAAAGRARLAAHDPARAREFFERALALEPDDFWTRQALFYAYAEEEEFDQALATADELVAAEPEWLGTPPDRHPNSLHLTAETTAAWARAYADDLADAGRRFDGLAAGAPVNAELRTARATLWLWRGWPHRALGEYDAALAALPPGNPEARAGRGHALLELGDQRAARGALQELQAIAPGYEGTRQLQHDIELREMRTLRLQASRTVSSGSQEGSENLGFDGWLHDRLYADRFRPYLHYLFRRAELPEGTAFYRRAGAGLEYQVRDVLLGAEIDRDVGSEVNAGIAANARWTPSDYWSFSAAADSYSDDVPLRGRFNEDIDGWSADLGADWRAHEGRSVHAGLGTAKFSDDNRRDSANLRGAQRLLTRPHWRMDALLGLYASRNTRTGASYFNPRSDFSYDVTLDNDWLLYRRYAYSFRHGLALSAGGYHQQDFGSDAIWALRYQQRWSPHERFELGWGIVRARRVYDGVPEYQTTLQADLAWRF